MCVEFVQQLISIHIYQFSVVLQTNSFGEWSCEQHISQYYYNHMHIVIHIICTYTIIHVMDED